MNTLGVAIVMAGATVSGGLLDGLGEAHALKALFRPHVVRHGPPPPTGPIMAPPVNHAGPGPGPGVGFGAQRRFQTTTSQVFFVDPSGMQIGWQAVGPEGQPVYLQDQLTVPARYNFRQGFIYRLKLTSIANNPGLVLYPTIEVAPSTPATDAYLTHNPIPVQFTQEDIDQITAGNFVTKVVYLPEPKFQEVAVAGLYGAETLVSTRLEPGVDPILEADKRGTILLILRAGAIDLEMPTGGALGAPGHVIYGEPGTVSRPGAPVMDAVPPPPAEMVPLDQPPVSPAGPGLPPQGGAPPQPPPATPPSPPTLSPSTSIGAPGGGPAVSPVSISSPAPEANQPLPLPDDPDGFGGLEGLDGLDLLP